MKKGFALKSDNLHSNRRAITPAFALRFDARAFPQLAGAGLEAALLGAVQGGIKQAHAQESVLHLLYDLNEKRAVCSTI
jgi:CRP-like cAMP-binding protein